MMLKKFYCHIVTGSVATREEWELAYDREELALRGLTAAQAFQQDENRSLLEMEMAKEQAE